MGGWFWLKHTLRVLLWHLTVDSDRSRDRLINISDHLEVTSVSRLGLTHANLSILIPHSTLCNESLHKVFRELLHFVDQESIAIVINVGEAKSCLDQLNLVDELGRLKEWALLLNSIALPSFEELVVWVSVVTTILIIRDLFATLLFFNLVSLFHCHTVVLILELVSLLRLGS